MFFPRIINVINGEKNVDRKNDSSNNKKSYTHDVLLWRIAIANNNIVPGQCAEYNASSYLPVKPNEMEYNIQMKARIIGYHFKINNFIIFSN